MEARSYVHGHRGSVLCWVATVDEGIEGGKYRCVFANYSQITNVRVLQLHSASHAKLTCVLLSDNVVIIIIIIIIIIIVVISNIQQDSHV